VQNKGNNKSLRNLYKAKGLLFPTTEEEIMEFEKHSSVDNETPPHWDNPSEIINKGLISGDSIAISKVISLSISQTENLAMAARSGNEISREIRSKMNQDRKDAERK
jgi:hypothetical protein